MARGASPQTGGSATANGFRNAIVTSFSGTPQGASGWASGTGAGASHFCSVTPAGLTGRNALASETIGVSGKENGVGVGRAWVRSHQANIALPTHTIKPNTGQRRSSQQPNLNFIASISTIEKTGNMQDERSAARKDSVACSKPLPPVARKAHLHRSIQELLAFLCP